MKRNILQLRRRARWTGLFFFMSLPCLILAMQIEAAAPLVSDKQDTLRPLRTRIIFEYVPEITESWQAPQAPSSCMLPLGIKISAFHDWLRPDADIPRRGKTILMPDDLFS